MCEIPDLPRLNEFLAHFAATVPDRLALVGGECQWTYGQLASHVNRLSAAMLSCGVKPGDRVAVMGTPRPECFTVMLAACKIGAITLGLNPKFPAQELVFFVNDAQPTLLIGFQSDAEGDHTDKLQAIRTACPSVQRVVALADGCTTWESFQSEGDNVDLNQALSLDDLPPRHPALIVYTSGTTGHPKGAVLPECGLVYCSRVQAERWQMGAHPSKALVNLPVNHIGFMGDMCSFLLVAGGTMYFMEKFDPQGILQLVQSERLTAIGQVPTMFQMIVGQPNFADFDLSSLKRIIWGGACAPRELLEILASTGAKLSTSYGMTETTGSITYTSDDADMDELVNTVGQPDSRFDVRIADASGNTVAVGEEGEIQVRGDHVMIEYWNRPDVTASAFTDDHWMHTGDVAVLRDDGCYCIRGRLSGMYKSGGENVYPREVEIVLEEYPDVAMAAVIGVPDPMYQEVGVAYVMPFPGCDPKPETLREYCKQRLANFKVPKRITVSPELPMLPIGKIDRMALKDQAVTAR